jgi:oxygen-independent coproporphyrinogen-3 oxidase
VLPTEDVGKILQAAEELFGFTDNVEISLEANPGTVSAESLHGFKAAGVNRLSIGVQSLCDRNLHRLGRQHDVAAAHATIDNARKAGFDNISCDLMFALPGQSVDGLAEDLDILLEHQPEHLAVYGLTIEEGTPFFSLLEQGQLELPDDDQYITAYRLLHDKLASAGYRHYEISNFARPGFECRHNQRYWQRQPNLAIGAGAHSFYGHGWGERRAVADDLAEFSDKIRSECEPSQTIESFDRLAAMAETLYLGLRTDRGVDAEQFRKSFSADLEEVYPEAVKKCGEMLALKEGSWRLNLDGWLLFNTLLSHFH